MRLFFFIFFLTFYSFSLFSADFSQLEKANKLFENGLFVDAGIMYDSLIQKGLDSEDVLYKSAYIAERLGKQGMAIFFLRKIQKNYGNKEIDRKIREISEKIESDGVLTVENHPYIDQLSRNKLSIWAGILLILLATAYINYKSKFRTYRIASSVIVIFVICIQIVLLYFVYFQAPSLVIIDRSSFYDAPSFAAPHQNDLIAPGSVLTILERKDVWYKIRYDQKEHWLPRFAVREL